MASPEALLLRHRMYTTNICKKVIRSPLRRLFKIGHLCVYFFVIFHNFPWSFRPFNPSEPASSKTGFCAIVQGMATPVRCRLRASLRVRILTPGHQKGGRVARYFLLSVALNSVAKTALLVSSCDQAGCGSNGKESFAMAHGPVP